MQRTLLPLLLVLVGCSRWTSGLCTLENGTTAHCHELEDVRYIETYDLETLKAPLTKPLLHPGFFVNLTSLRHLDLSGGVIERIEPGSFGKLTNLRSLNLAENHLRFPELDFTDGLNHLHSLNLRKNDLRQLPPALTRLKFLKHLDVQGNPLQCNCATLTVKDLIVQRGVKISRKVLCTGPSNLKGSSLLKLDAAIICRFEEQDREMQNDQARKDFEEEYGSGDLFEKETDNGEYVDVPTATPFESSKELEVETPFPTVSDVSTTASSPASKSSEPLPTSTSAVDGTTVSIEMTDPVQNTTEKDEELFFDSEEKKGYVSTVATTTEKKKVYKDALFYPVEGSGDGDDGSGEGSGTGMIFGDWQKVGEVDRTEEKEEDSTQGTGWFDMIFNVLWTSTEAPKVTGDPDLEEEQFIAAFTGKEADEESIVAKNVDLDEALPGSTTPETITKTSTTVPSPTVEVVDDELHDMTKLENVKVDDETVNDELAEVSSAKQSKKGMGSYVVLAILLVVLATLIRFAAYKSDFCRKKRRRGDVENGAELKDMQKALLETGNLTQPKIASNGNLENAPLVVDTPAREEGKAIDDCQVTVDVPKSPNGITDRAEMVKPSRSSGSQNDHEKARDTVGQDTSSFKEDSLSGRTSSIDPVVNTSSDSRLPEVNGPPLSPGAQRVKITLQENPDSVPRTPILITRTMAGENLVKMP